MTHRKLQLNCMVRIRARQRASTVQVHCWVKGHIKLFFTQTVLDVVITKPPWEGPMTPNIPPRTAPPHTPSSVSSLPYLHVHVHVHSTQLQVGETNETLAFTQ